MTKPLSEMTNAELWALFPVNLERHNPAWAERYARERERIARALGWENIRRISHIGSTAVPGLVAKPTIDILLEIADGCDLARLNAALTSDGYIFSAQPDKPPPHMMWMKGYTPQGFAGQAYHLHVRYGGDWEELYFRDWLIANRCAAEAYGRLKERLKREYAHDRDAYTAGKAQFVREGTALARGQFEARHLPH